MICGEEFLLMLAQGLKLAVVIVQDSHRAGKAQFQRAARHGERIIGIPHRAAQHRVDIHLENRIAREHLELAIEHLQAFLGNLVGLDVVDGNLQVVQAGAVQVLDALRRQQVAVGNHARQNAVPANAADNFFQMRVQQRLASADGNDRGAERRQQIDAVEHLFQRDGLGEIVKLVAVSAGKIAAADGNQVRQDRVALGGKPLGNHAPLAQARVHESKFSPQGEVHCFIPSTFGDRVIRCSSSQSLAILRIDAPSTC